MSLFLPRTSVFTVLSLVLTCLFSVSRAGAGVAEAPEIQADTPGEPRVQFVDVALEAGLKAPNVWGGVHSKKYIIETKGSGLGFIDYDSDGWLDIYLTNGIRFEEEGQPNPPISRLYRNSRDGTFSDVTRTAGLGRTGWQTGVCVGDFDNDGWDDFYAGFWGQSVLFRNGGDGAFRDVTEESGLTYDGVRWASGCTWLDYDLDGFLDLYVSHYIDLDLEVVPAPGDNSDCVWKGIPVLCGPRGLPGSLDRLYRNQGNGTFKDVSEETGISAAGRNYAITPVSFDFNNDGWPDIYVAVDSEPSLLYVNQHDGTFVEMGMITGVAFSEDGKEQAGMGVGIGDYDVNGWLDIFKTNFQNDTCNLYQNLGDGTFRDVSRMVGIGTNTRYVNWGAGFIDYDNDGWIDIFHVTGHVYPSVDEHQLDAAMRTPRIVYRNLGDGRFADVSESLGPGVTEKFSSRGCAFGDYDNDGDVDVLVLNMNDRYSLLRCDSQTGNSWIKFRLQGKAANRSAIGARVRVVTGEHIQTGEVTSGGSVMSQNDLRLHFGLGTAERVDLVEVIWPGREAVEQYRDLKVNQILTIREGTGIIEDKAPE